MVKTSSPNGLNGIGRDRLGRFGLGNAGGPGRIARQKLADLHKLLADNVPEENWKAIIAKLVEKAKAGDILAARELLDRRYGKAIPAEPETAFAVQVNVSGSLSPESVKVLDELEIETARLKAATSKVVTGDSGG